MDQQIFHKAKWMKQRPKEEKVGIVRVQSSLTQPGTPVKDVEPGGLVQKEEGTILKRLRRGMT